jgi:hypothetical protein
MCIPCVMNAIRLTRIRKKYSSEEKFVRVGRKRKECRLFPTVAASAIAKGACLLLLRRCSSRWAGDMRRENAPRLGLRSGMAVGRFTTVQETH